MADTGETLIVILIIVRGDGHRFGRFIRFPRANMDNGIFVLTILSPRRCYVRTSEIHRPMVRGFWTWYESIEALRPFHLVRDGDNNILKLRTRKTLRREKFVLISNY